MSNRSFSEVFTSSMNSMGLPVPESLVGTFTTTLGGVGAIATALATVGPTATVSELLLTIPTATLSAGFFVGMSEVVAVVGACAAAFYVGACIGSVLIAAYETLDSADLLRVASWLKGLSSIPNVAEFLHDVHKKHPQFSPARESIVLATRMKTSPSFDVCSNTKIWPGVYQSG